MWFEFCGVWRNTYKVAMDLLPVDRKYILVMIDYYTIFMWTDIISDKSKASIL